MRHGDHHGDWCIVWQRGKKHHRTRPKLTLWLWLHLNVNSHLQTLHSLATHVRSVARRISGGALYEITFGLSVAKSLSSTAICAHIKRTKKEIWSDTLLYSISWRCRVESGIACVAVSDILFWLFVFGRVWADATTSAFRFLICNRSSTGRRREGGN